MEMILGKWHSNAIDNAPS